MNEPTPGGGDEPALVHSAPPPRGSDSSLPPHPTAYGPPWARASPPRSTCRPPGPAPSPSSCGRTRRSSRRARPPPRRGSRRSASRGSAGATGGPLPASPGSVAQPPSGRLSRRAVTHGTLWHTWHASHTMTGMVPLRRHKVACSFGPPQDPDCLFLLSCQVSLAFASSATPIHTVPALSLSFVVSFPIFHFPTPQDWRNSTFSLEEVVDERSSLVRLLESKFFALPPVNATPPHSAGDGGSFFSAAFQLLFNFATFHFVFFFVVFSPWLFFF